ncbi:MAG: ATP-binding cassette domain-containing protein [Deltaproteobacteria bacterium]|nr:ATP-binding cassette domain-containing protein [Deltaproteobacteria bacterium]
MIRTENLTKCFGRLTAVDRLNLSVPKGEIFGLLGPNGAGKTTTIRMLTTLAKITEGRAVIDGLDVAQEPIGVKRLIGVAPQGLNLEIELTAEENLEYHGRLHQMPRRERRRRISELLNFSDLEAKAKVQVDHFSGGMKRRLLIARALMHDPRVLFLDEPTVGLDPQIRRKIWGLIEELKSRGITVLLTTHYIEEAEALCERVGILRKGKMIALDSPGRLKEKVGAYVVECNNKNGCEIHFCRTREEAVAYAGRLRIDVTIRHTNLEDVFLNLTGEKILD